MAQEWIFVNFWTLNGLVDRKGEKAVRKPFLSARHGLADEVSCHGGDEKKGACEVSVK